MTITLARRTKAAEATFIFGADDGNRFSRLDAARSPAALTASKAVIHYRLLRFPPKKKTKAAEATFAFLEQMTGIGPA